MLADLLEAMEHVLFAEQKVMLMPHINKAVNELDAFCKAHAPYMELAKKLPQWNETVQKATQNVRDIKLENERLLDENKALKDKINAVHLN